MIDETLLSKSELASAIHWNSLRNWNIKAALIFVITKLVWPSANLTTQQWHWLRSSLLMLPPPPPPAEAAPCRRVPISLIFCPQKCWFTELCQSMDSPWVQSSSPHFWWLDAEQSWHSFRRRHTWIWAARMLFFSSPQHVHLLISKFAIKYYPYQGNARIIVTV